MDGAGIAQWGATGVIAIALIVTWIRNGRDKAKKYGALETEVGNLKDRVTEVKDDINKRIDGICSRLDGIDNRLDGFSHKRK